MVVCSVGELQTMRIRAARLGQLTLTGEMTGLDLRVQLVAALTAAQDEGLDCLLVDMREVSLSTTTEGLISAAGWLKECGQEIRVAYLATSPTVTDIHFMTLCVRDREAGMESFRSFERAINWLLWNGGRDVEFGN
jgi:hypothetical protein